MEKAVVFVDAHAFRSLVSDRRLWRERSAFMPFLEDA